ncbi:hypothetical protein BKA83DRAFT_677501 [Pisolithus microcarpus]|nr:hypothetical protein BKA83DRAFT_677501 [Pisolithus microcarpus]
MRLYGTLLIFLTVVHATSWFGSDDPVDCSSITSAPDAAQSHASRQAQAASRAVSVTAAQATREVAPKDHVFSTWDDSRLRKWLEDHGVANTRTELLSLANRYLHKASDPVWQTWSDSYMREWLVAHNLLSPRETPPRETLLDQMKRYYYSATDKIWNVWSESELKAWLVNHGFLKSDAQKQRDELIKMVEDHYLSVSDNVWGAWRDADIREWLTTHWTRDELVDLIDSKYADASAKSASYLLWPDARLRAYLRERGMRDAVNSGMPLAGSCDALADREQAKDFAWEKGYKQPMDSASESLKRGTEGMRQAGEKVWGKGDEL